MAGLTDRAALVEHHGLQRGVQLDLSPTVARRVSGEPMSELEGRVVDLDDLLPRGAWGLAARAGRRAGGAERPDEVERTLGGLITEDRDVGHRVGQWAVARIAGSGGRVDVAALAKRNGYSHKDLTRLFGRQAG